MDCPLKKTAKTSPNTLAFDGISYADLDTKTDEMVSYLKANGLESGHLLAVQLPTKLLFITLLFASIRIGSIFCPLSLRLPPAAIQAQIAILQPRLFFSDSMESYPADKKNLPPSSFLLFTSGSSSAPKIVSLSLANFLAAASAAIDLCNFTPGDAWLLSLPLHHVGGLAIIFRALLANASFLTDPKDSIITHISLVPTQLYRAWPIYPRLKTVLLSGAPIHNIPEKLPIITAYGMTETASMIIGKKNGLPYLGHPLPGKEMRLGKDGEILVRGDSLFQGYWDGQTLHPPGDWFATKDLGTYDSKLGFAIMGRKDNQFISGGENIQPEEIERELMAHPKIIEALVVPQPDPEFGMRPRAFIRSTEQLEADALKKFLLESLPKYKVPLTFHPLAETEDLKRSRKQSYAD